MKIISRLFRGRINQFSYLLALFLFPIPAIMLSFLYAVVNILLVMFGIDAAYTVVSTINANLVTNFLINGTFVVLLLLASIYLVLFIFGSTVRRLHDMNLSGWLSLLLLVPYLNLLFVLVLLIFQYKKENKYGLPSRAISFKKVVGLS